MGDETLREEKLQDQETEMAVGGEEKGRRGEGTCTWLNYSGGTHPRSSDSWTERESAFRADNDS